MFKLIRLFSSYKMQFTGLNRAKVKELGSYSVVFIVERILTGLLPLVILYLTDKDTYTRLEFIFSIATLLLPISDFLTRMYFFYGYSVSEQREKFLKVSCSILTGQLILILSASLFFLFSNKFDIFYALIRLGYLSFYFFLIDYLRLENNQGKIIRDSIILNSSIILFTTADYYLFHTHSNLLFPFIVIMQLGYIFYQLRKQKAMISLWSVKEIFPFFKKSMLYAFPILINLSISVFIQNYLKVHFYHNDNKQLMLVLSILLRLGLSIQIIHALLQSYFSKRIFLQELSFKRFFTGIYLPMLLLAGFAISFIEVIYFSYFNTSIQIGASVILLVNLYFLLWCISAILEILFTSRNKTLWLLGINVFCLACTFLIFFSFQLDRSNDLNKLVALMCCQPAIFTLFVILFYKNVFKKKVLVSYG